MNWPVRVAVGGMGELADDVPRHLKRFTHHLIFNFALLLFFLLIRHTAPCHESFAHQDHDRALKVSLIASGENSHARNIQYPALHNKQHDSWMTANIMNTISHKMGEVCFVGAGPGAVDLITVRGREWIGRAGAILYAGSLVSPRHLDFAPHGCVIADSSGMTLEEMIRWLLEQTQQHDIVVRLQTGDPSLYGAMPEMIQPLLQAGVAVTVIPGVPSFAAAAATAMETLTLPESTQTVILTRVEGRTPMPKGERLRDLAAHGATLALHLSIQFWPRIREELLSAGWSDEAPALVVHKASWPGEERIVRGTLATIGERCQQAGIHTQSMILLGPTLGACRAEESTRSRLYHPEFEHGCRSLSTLASQETELT
ncbi:MAG: precorrin-4 C(11)-methyltransferase [Magnetococcus sp. YQC-5]